MLQSERQTYADLVRNVEAPLRRAMIATFGVERGTEATAEALAYGWEHWDRLSRMENPTGYLYKVGRSRAIDVLRRPRRFLPEVPPAGLPHVEPALPAALRRLSRNQRVAVWLIHGYGCPYQEVAEILGTSIGTVQKHVTRALEKLRTDLEVDDE